MNSRFLVSLGLNKEDSFVPRVPHNLQCCHKHETWTLSPTSPNPCWKQSCFESRGITRTACPSSRIYSHVSSCSNKIDSSRSKERRTRRAKIILTKAVKMSSADATTGLEAFTHVLLMARKALVAIFIEGKFPRAMKVRGDIRHQYLGPDYDPECVKIMVSFPLNSD